jgi:hypothetical protein
MIVTRLSLRGKVKPLIGVAAVAALIAGCITGTQLTIEDHAWPARGGMEAVVQISILFTLYAFPVALAAGAFAWFALQPLMARAGLDGPISHLAVGLLLGLAVHLLVDLGIRERIDGSEDFAGGAVAGGVAGLLWWLLVRRREGFGSA